MSLDKVEITAMILQLCINGASRHELQSKTELEDGQLEEYLQLLISKKLINFGVDNRAKSRSKQVIPTDRGIRFLNMYEAIKIRYLTVPTAQN
jgi:predicted transcriptional regulator